jgi:hypothetical protein
MIANARTQIALYHLFKNRGVVNYIGFDSAELGPQHKGHAILGGSEVSQRVHVVLKCIISQYNIRDLTFVAWHVHLNNRSTKVSQLNGRYCTIGDRV